MDEDDKVAQEKRPMGDSDDEEDMPDYSVLSALSKRHLSAGLPTDVPAPSIPKRGEKDFEPTGFGGQAKVLDQSREALFSTVSLPRAHSSKSLSTATWDPIFQRAIVHTQRGQSCVNVGVSERRAKAEGFATNLELFPEETVYLIERGALDCRWTRTPGQLPEPQDFSSCMPISVAQAYAQILGCNSCTLSRYQIYAYLKRLGYIVQRAALVDKIRASSSGKASVQQRRYVHAVISWIFSRVAQLMASILYLLRLVVRSLRSKPRGLLGIRPLDSYDSIFQKLQIVSTGSRFAPSSDQEHLTPFFYAWRPATRFKRTQPPPPEFRICVLEADKHPMLRVGDFETLFSHVPLGASGDVDEAELAEIREQNSRAYGKQRKPRTKAVSSKRPTHFNSIWQRLAWLLQVLGSLVQRLYTCGQTAQNRATAHSRPTNVYIPLKAGRRSVVVAVVDQGTTSLLRFGEAEFARWRLAGEDR